jgi:virginiamycin B lyase
MTPSGQATQFSIPNGTNVLPTDITTGPNHNLWFTEIADAVGEVTTSGAFLSLCRTSRPSEPSGVTLGPDGRLWFAERAGNAIGRLAAAGCTYVAYPIPSPRALPTGIAAGPDGNLWFTEPFANKIGCIAP